MRLVIRQAALVVAVAAICLMVTGAPDFLKGGSAIDGGSANPVVLENQKSGTTAWRIPGPGMKLADDRTGQIKGYPDAGSVNAGNAIRFKVSVTPAQRYRVDVYRTGYYGGDGGRLVAGSGWRDGTTQPPCLPQSDTGLVECRWASGWELRTGRGWTSGLYLAVLTSASGYQNYAPFVVRNDGRRAALLVAEPDTTYQAYNSYPADGANGKSLYGGWGRATASGTVRAVKVSFDRPYAHTGVGNYFADRLAFGRWLEANGYDATYVSGVDLDAGTVQMRSYRAFISPGHDEYWSTAMYDQARRARDAGTSMLFLAANNVYWKIRFEPSSAGVPRRVVVCYRTAGSDPAARTVTDETLMWRDNRIGRPEQELLGVMYTGIVAGEAPYVVSGADHWFWRGTGLRDGDTVPGMVLGEADRKVEAALLPEFSEYRLLSASPYTDSKGRQQIANSVVYRSARSGAWVFTAGTFGWPRLLGEPGRADPRIQHATVNLLGRALRGDRAPGVTALAGTGDAGSVTAAAQVSRATFAPGPPVVYVAPVHDPDATAAAAVAAGHAGGPLLYCDGNTVPRATAEELARLKARRIVVVGDRTAIGDGVLTALSVFGTVSRAEGKDTAGTAAVVSARTWTATGDAVAYVVAEDAAADLIRAVSGSARGGPILFTGRDVLAQATADELRRLRPDRIVAVGDGAGFSPAVSKALAATAPVRRVEAATPVQATVELTRDSFGAAGPTAMYLVTGNAAGIPAAGAAAAARRAPVVYAGSAPEPDAVAEAEVRRLAPGRITVIGDDRTPGGSLTARLRALH